MPSRKVYTSLFLIILFAVVYLLKDHFNGPLYEDEHHYLLTAILFSADILPSHHLLTSYNELNTPIPFILGGWTVRLFGEDIQYLRLLTYSISFLLLMTFVWNSPDRSKRFWLCLAGLLAFPNYYLCSVYYYTDIFAMLTVLAGLAAYIKRAHFLGMLFFVAGVSCRQYMLAFPAAIIVFELFNALKRSESIVQFVNQVLSNRAWILYSAALLSIVPWVLLWHGLAPTKVMAAQYYDTEKLINYTPGYIIYSAVCVAVYYVIPEMIFTGKMAYFLNYPKKNPVFFMILVLVVLSLIFFFPAKQEHNPYFTWPYLGYIDQFLVTVGIKGIIKQICFGILMLITCMRFFSPQINLAGWMVLVNILLLGKAQLSWDKYSLPLIMLLWFLALFDEHWLKESDTVKRNQYVQAGS